jgi:glycosyltransferase involved in cell wall biosynthesis
VTQRPTALIATPHSWTSPFRLGSHQIARALAAQGWDVAFISNPISPLHLIGGRGEQLAARAEIWRAGGVTDLGGRIWAYVPAALGTPHRAPILRSAWLHRSWHRLTVPSVVRTVTGRGFGDVDLLYVDSVVQGFWLDAVRHRRSVMRIGDRMSGFTAFTPEMRRLEAELARRVDLVAYSAETLEEHVREIGARRMLHLPNGVDAAHFLGATPEPPADLEGIRRPIAIYVGALDDWFDFVAVDRLVTELPEVSVVLIGPGEEARRRLTPAVNLHVLGRRSYADLPAYLRNADVGLIPFDARGHPDLVNSINPLKLYEYMASGIPVVATRWAELERLGSPAILVDQQDRFADGVRRALGETFDRDGARRFVESADWAHRVRDLLVALS